MAALLAISDAIVGGRPLSEILHLVVANAAKLCDAEHAAIGLLKGESLEFDYQVGFPGNRCERTLISQGITGWVARNNRIQNLPNAKEDERFFNDLPSLEIKSELVAPIAFQDNVLGVLDLESSRPAAFTDRHEAIVEQLTRRAGLARFSVGDGIGSRPSFRQSFRPLSRPSPPTSANSSSPKKALWSFAARSANSPEPRG